MYSKAEIDRQLYEISQVGLQRGLNTEYNPLNTIPQGADRIQYLQARAGLANSLETEIDAYRPLVPIMTELEDARNENAMLRSNVSRNFFSEVKHNEFILTARLSPNGQRISSIKNDFMQKTRGPIRSWRMSGRKLTALYQQEYQPRIITELNDAYFEAVEGDQFSLSIAFDKAMDELRVLNPELSFRQEQQGPTAIDMRRPLNQIADQSQGKFETLRAKTLGIRSRKAAGYMVFGGFVASLFAPGEPSAILTGAGIGLGIGLIINVPGMYSDLAKKRSSEWNRVVDQGVLPIFRQYVLGQYKVIETNLTNTVKAAAQSINLNYDATYNAVRSTHNVLEAGVISHKAKVMKYALRLAYAQTINPLITEGGGTAVTVGDDLDIYFQKVESSIAGNPNELAIRELIKDGQRWIAAQSEKRAEQMEELAPRIDAMEVALKDLLEKIPVKSTTEEQTNGEQAEAEAEAEAEAADAKSESDESAKTAEAETESDADDGFITVIAAGLGFVLLGPLGAALAIGARAGIGTAVGAFGNR